MQFSDADRIIAQLTVAEARNVAKDILNSASHAEADAMIVRFFGKLDLSAGALGAFMQEFRDFRYELEMEHVRRPAELFKTQERKYERRPAGMHSPRTQGEPPPVINSASLGKSFARFTGYWQRIRPAAASHPRRPPPTRRREPTASDSNL